MAQFLLPSSGMMKAADQREFIDVGCDELIQDAMAAGQGRYVLPRRKPEMGLLSRYEIQCIEKTITQYGDKSF